jgi:hypothetical protein
VIFFARRDRETRIKKQPEKVTTSRTRVVVFREKIIPQEFRAEPFRKKENHRKFVILFRTIPQKMTNSAKEKNTRILFRTLDRKKKLLENSSEKQWNDL